MHAATLMRTLLVIGSSLLFETRFRTRRDPSRELRIMRKYTGRPLVCNHKPSAAGHIEEAGERQRVITPFRHAAARGRARLFTGFRVGFVPLTGSRRRRH